MHAENQVLLAVALVLIGIAIGTVMESDLSGGVMSDFLTVSATLFSAFLGAWTAFELQNRKAERDVKNAQIAALNRALFSLTLQINKLRNVENQVVQPIKHTEMAFVTMQAIHALEKDEIPLDLNTISFILETPSRNLLAGVALAHASFRSAIDAINFRSQIHISSFQPLLEKAGIRSEQVFTIEDPEKFLGSKLYITLRRATDDLVHSTEAAVKKLEAASAALSEFGKQTFGPGRIIVNIVSANEPQT